MRTVTMKKPRRRYTAGRCADDGNLFIKNIQGDVRYLTLKVVSVRSAHKIAMIQKRVTTFVSCQPMSS